jgi:Pyridoxamine 5'-phosphate oxidase
MEKTELFAYLRGQCLGVLGTLSRDNEPQGALVGYAVTSDLEILFDTVRTSRKYGNMIANPRVSFAVGNTVGKGDERTVRTRASRKSSRRIAGAISAGLLCYLAGRRRPHSVAGYHLVCHPSPLDSVFRLHIPKTQEWRF